MLDLAPIRGSIDVPVWLNKVDLFILSFRSGQLFRLHIVIVFHAYILVVW